MTPPTAEELAGIDYPGVGSFNEGIQASDFSREYTGYNFKNFIWWKAYPCELADGALGPNGETPEQNGRIYVRQELADDVKCLVYQTKRDVQDADFGLIAKGSTGISVLPEQAELARLDRVAFTDVTLIARAIIERTGDSFTLPFDTVVSVEKMLLLRAGENAVEVPADEYEVTDTGGDWLSDDVVQEGDFISVEFRYMPKWVFLLDEQGVVQTGSDGNKLPQRGIVIMERN